MTGRGMTSPAVAARGRRFPLGAAVTLAELEEDPHPVLARLRDAEPVSWVPVLDGWLVTRRDLALQVMRDSATFTVDDPRFSTARIVGPSMLSLDGGQHDRHRRPFTGPFSQPAVHDQLEAFVTGEADRLVSVMRPAGRGDLGRSLAAPLAVAVVARVLGLGQLPPDTILSWYDAIVGAVSQLAAACPGRRSRQRPQWRREWRRSGSSAAACRRSAGNGAGASLLADAARPVPRAGRGLPGTGADAAGLSPDEIVSNAAVLMFGGIETTEGMIANAAWHLLSHPGQLGPGHRGPRAAAAGHRGVAAPRTRGRGRGPLRHPRRGYRRRRSEARRPGQRVGGRRGPGSGRVHRPGPLRRAPRQRRAEPGLRPRPALLPGRAPGPAGSPRRAGRRPRPAARPAARPGPPRRTPRPGVPQAPVAARALGRSGPGLGPG